MASNLISGISIASINFGRYNILVRITFSNIPDEAILFWLDESLSAIQLFSVPQKTEGLSLLTFGIKQNEKPTPTFRQKIWELMCYFVTQMGISSKENGRLWKS